MPWGDGTGPLGLGPGFWGRGWYGFGRGWGWGRGWWWHGGPWGAPGYAYWADFVPPWFTPEDERIYLENRKNWLEKELKDIRKRLDELNQTTTS